MGVFGADDFDEHERVVHFRDPGCGLRAIVAVHSTALGPAIGGCRMWPYPSAAEALRDVLRLSRGMSYKNALAGLPLGGGKTVIIGDPQRDKSEALLERFGECVESLGGGYVTAEDSGISVPDMDIMRRRTRHVCGLSPACGGSGDPAPATAWGVYLGIRAALAFRAGEPELRGIRVAVQGLGAVGGHLCRHLAAAGAELLVADVAPERAQRVCAETGARAVSAGDILRVDADVFAPCALGAVLDARAVAGLKVSIVAGAANNQLATSAEDEALSARGILYAPDYVINAGGIIQAAHEHLRLGDAAAVRCAVERIPERLRAIFEQATANGRPTGALTDDLARRRLARAGHGARGLAPSAA